MFCYLTSLSKTLWDFVKRDRRPWLLHVAVCFLSSWDSSDKFLLRGVSVEPGLGYKHYKSLEDPGLAPIAAPAAGPVAPLLDDDMSVVGRAGVAGRIAAPAVVALSEASASSGAAAPPLEEAAAADAAAAGSSGIAPPLPPPAEHPPDDGVQVARPPAVLPDAAAPRRCDRQRGGARVPRAWAPAPFGAGRVELDSHSLPLVRRPIQSCFAMGSLVCLLCRKCCMKRASRSNVFSVFCCCIHSTQRFDAEYE